jgi:hypothetical protein
LAYLAQITTVRASATEQYASMTIHCRDWRRGKRENRHQRKPLRQFVGDITLDRRNTHKRIDNLVARSQARFTAKRLRSASEQ